MTVLVVDDNPKTLAFLKKVLTKASYTVIAIDNARDALTILSKKKVNLIISDIAMPDINGIEFCRIIRENQKLGYIPLIFLTALSSVDDHATGLIAGADDYLTKPIHVKELLAKIKEYAM